MKSIRKPRPSYIIVLASAAQLSLTGCHSASDSTNPKPSCAEKYDASCPTVNPPVSHQDLEKFCDEHPGSVNCPSVNPPPPPFIRQFNFDTLSMEVIGGLSPENSGELQKFTIKTDALNRRQNEILNSVYQVDLTRLSCAPETDGSAYKMVLYSNQTTLHTIISNDGYCLETKSLSNVSFVEATALRDFYQTKP